MLGGSPPHPMSDLRQTWLLPAATALLPLLAHAQSTDWAALREQGALRSQYSSDARTAQGDDAAATADLATYGASIRPILERRCFRCHGEKRQKGDVQVKMLTHDGN